MKKIILFTIIILSSLANLFAQSEAKIMTYNLLNYDSTIDTNRNSYFREIINATQPDILVVEEILSQSSVDVFLNNVMRAVNSNYNSGIFIDGPYTKNAVFYDNSKFQFITNTVIPTNVRDINEFKTVHIASGDTLRIYAVHLKASQGVDNENKRADEVDELRIVTDALPTGKDFIVVGDFNLYKDSEPAYLKLLDQTKNGYFIDPINITGTWNNSSYAIYHTQATRESFGGLDDRFDMILFSKSVSQPGGIQYVQNSTIPYGNDGNHFNKSINEQPNNAVSIILANALYNASDHLPVIATFQFFNVTGINDNNLSLPNHFSLSQNYPNPFNPETTISYTIGTVQLSALSFVTLKLFDVLGREVSTLVNEEKPAGTYKVKFNAKYLTSGIYFYRLSTNGFVQTKKMILLR